MRASKPHSDGPIANKHTAHYLEDYVDLLLAQLVELQVGQRRRLLENAERPDERPREDIAPHTANARGAIYIRTRYTCVRDRQAENGDQETETGSVRYVTAWSRPQV